MIETYRSLANSGGVKPANRLQKEIDALITGWMRKNCPTKRRLLVEDVTGFRHGTDDFRIGRIYLDFLS